MAFPTRRVVGLGVAVAALSLAAVASSNQRASALETAKGRAHAAADEALAKVGADVEALAVEVAGKAERGAHLTGIEALTAVVTSQSDFTALSQTFADFEREPFFTPFAAVGPHAFFVGEQSVYASDPTLGELWLPLVRSAVVSGRAQALKGSEGAVWAVGVGRTKNMTVQQQAIFFVLAERVTAEWLGKTAADHQVAVLLASDGKAKEAVGAGSPEQVDTLRRALNSMKAPESPGFARKPLVSGIEVLVFKDPAPLLAAAEVEGTAQRPVFFGVASFIALLALIFAFRPSKPEPDSTNTELLKQTADQLRQSQEQLQRISQQLRVNTDRFTPPAPDDGLGSTQASVQSSRYEIVAPLGEGGMARVSVAVVRGAEGFKRSFVLKRLRPELANNQEVVNQFIDEARLGASLVHSNIVPVFDFGRDADGYFLAQEYILGRDVDAVIEASKRKRGTALELPTVLYLAQEGLKALAYAHTRRNDAGQPMGLVHRDVSPNNLMVSARGEVKLLDFGIVKSADRVTKTQAGVVKGNLFFMSPEQARALEVDPRSDLFSMGMVIVSACTGRPLYSGDNVYELMNRAGAGLTDADRQRVRDECGPLAPVLLRVLSVDPKDRFADADAFAQALAQVGPSASAGEVQALMESLFADDFAAERQKFSVGG